MMHQARSNNHRTGTQLFAEDEPLSYLARLVESRDVEFTALEEAPHASGFDPGRVLQEILGRIA
jgi:hypothetical protein